MFIIAQVNTLFTPFIYLIRPIDISANIFTGISVLNSKGTMVLLKVKLFEYHDKYMELGFIPSYAYENFCDMYESYHELGGNGTGTKMYEEIKQLHLRNNKGE